MLQDGATTQHFPGELMWNVGRIKRPGFFKVLSMLLGGKADLNMAHGAEIPLYQACKNPFFG